MQRWTPEKIPPQSGRLAVVTGTEGIGYEISLALARAGAQVIAAGIDEARGLEAVRRICAAVPQARVRFELLDVASLASVAAFARRLSANHRQLNVLINNAGVMALPKCEITEDGLERQMATNYFGPFALTAGLLPMLLRSEGPRVVLVSSVIQRYGKIRFDDLQCERKYRPWAAYCRSKLAVLLFAFELQRRSDTYGWGLQSYASHPGYARTELIPNGLGSGALLSRLSRTAGKLLSQSAAQGAWPALFAATANEAQPGGYYGPSGFLEFTGSPAPASAAGQARDLAMARKLWEVSSKVTSAKWPTE